MAEPAPLGWLTHGPLPPPGSQIPEPVLEILHRAYPSWDYGDTSTLLRLVESSHVGELSLELARDISGSTGIFCLSGPPEGNRIAAIVFMAQPEQPIPPAPPPPPTGLRKLLGRGPAPRRPGSRPGYADIGLCAVGPYAWLREYGPREGEEAWSVALRQEIPPAVRRALSRRGIELLPWSVLDIRVPRMAATLVDGVRWEPTVFTCLFERQQQSHS